jgi:hypothetical protein
MLSDTYLPTFRRNIIRPSGTLKTEAAHYPKTMVNISDCMSSRVWHSPISEPCSIFFTHVQSISPPPPPPSDICSCHNVASLMVSAFLCSLFIPGTAIVKRSADDTLTPSVPLISLLRVLLIFWRG